MPHDKSTLLYPLKFTPIYKEKVWGGRRLEMMGRNLPGTDETTIGESWEIADLGETSVSGGGGEAERSVIANGPLESMTLYEAMQRFGPRLMGGLEPTAAGDFPLLVKYLDAAENLSLQVHPSQSFARQHPEAHFKSEAWYVVAADPGAAIYKGVREAVDAQQLTEAIATNQAQQIEPLLVKVPVKAGDCHYLPSGTCHALGAGILVAEVQTPSDTTFRVFDWGRTGRQLHIDEAIRCIDFGPAKVDRYERRTHIAGIFTAVSCLVSCEYFRIEKVRMSQGYEQEIPYDQPTIWMVLEGSGQISMGSSIEPVVFSAGETMLMPASISEEAKVVLEEDTVWLEVTFPQAQRTQIA